MTDTVESMPHLDAPSGSRRLLVQLVDATPVDLRTHRRLFSPPQRARHPRTDIVDLVSRAGLRGRGGAGFPTAIKLAAVADQRGRPIVVVNGTEGEPTSRKDATLLRLSPNLVLDGAAQAAAAVGADEILVCIDRADVPARGSVESAIRQRERIEPGGVPATVLATPSRYVVGEETALVHWINGGEARPTLTPPRPFERGVDGRPTLINNVETLAHLAQIGQWGSDWFRERGTESEPGTALVTLSGAVRHPAVYEAGIGTPIVELLTSADVLDGVGAVLVGGYFGSWLSREQVAGARLSDESLKRFGGGLGCGAMVVLPAGGCGVFESARVLRWMAGETAGQCGPCDHGLSAIATRFEQLAWGEAGPDSVAVLRRWADDIVGRGACRFPDGAVRFLRSTLNVFAADLDRHAHGRPCNDGHQPPLLPVPPHSEVWR